MCLSAPITRGKCQGTYFDYPPAHISRYIMHPDWQRQKILIKMLDAL